MDILFLIGRILFVVMFVSSGIAHFAARREMAGYAAAKGAPGGEAGVLVTGAMLLVGSLLILLGVWADLGALLLLLFLLAAAWFMHRFWELDDEQQRRQEQLNFLRNITLAGAALILIWLFSEGGDDLPYTAGGSLF